MRHAIKKLPDISPPDPRPRMLFQQDLSALQCTVQALASPARPDIIIQSLVHNPDKIVVQQTMYDTITDTSNINIAPFLLIDYLMRVSCMCVCVMVQVVA